MEVLGSVQVLEMQGLQLRDAGRRMVRVSGFGYDFGFWVSDFGLQN